MKFYLDTPEVETLAHSLGLEFIRPRNGEGAVCIRVRAWYRTSEAGVSYYPDPYEFNNTRSAHTLALALLRATGNLVLADESVPAKDQFGSILYWERDELKQMIEAGLTRPGLDAVATPREGRFEISYFDTPTVIDKLAGM